MPSPDYEDALRGLYAAPPDGFVAARSDAVAAARAAGDRETAKRLAALKKPTVAAWMVNLVASRHPELIDELVELSGALRAAQRELRGDRLRSLSNRRRQLVSSLVDAARGLAVAAGAAKPPLAEVEATFTAALSEPEIAAQVRTGRLIRAVSYAGFGEVPRPRLHLVTDDEPLPDPPAPSPATGSPARERERLRRDLERRMRAAEAAERRAEALLRNAEDAERDAEHRVEDVEAELAELERRRTEAIADVARRKQDRRAAERAAAAARRQVGDVQAALDDVTADATTERA